MTQNQKQQIVTMRSQGSSFQAISEALDISINTVKSFYRREGKSLNPTCKQCGKPVEQKPRTRQKKFCCDKCRMKWWNSHPSEVKRKAVYEFTCAYCGQAFTAYGNNHRKYCSRPCYMKVRFKNG